MLILSRKINECIVIDGHIIVKILRIDRDTVKLGIQAPAELPVHRQEIFDAIQRNKQQSPQNAGAPLAPKTVLAHTAPGGSHTPRPESAEGSNGIAAPK